MAEHDPIIVLGSVRLFSGSRAGNAGRAGLSDTAGNRNANPVPGVDGEISTPDFSETAVRSSDLEPILVGVAPYAEG